MINVDKPFQVELFILGKNFDVKKYNEAHSESRGKVHVKAFFNNFLGLEGNEQCIICTIIILIFLI